MNWIYDHTEVITTAALILIPIFIIGGMMILASGNTPEASDLQGAPETLGDFPPLTERDRIKFIQRQWHPSKGDIRVFNSTDEIFDGEKWGKA